LEVCACEQRERENVELKVHLDSRRYGKKVTVVEGFDEDPTRASEVARALKAACAAGGTAKDGRVELQGNHLERVVDSLRKMGFQVRGT
jgi:translation initiation factor 1